MSHSEHKDIGSYQNRIDMETLTPRQREILKNPFPLEVEGDVWLNLSERRIFGTLRAAIEWFGLAVEPRVAGGWVRDKLMNLESEDIDISLDSMMGEDFSRLILQYVEMMGGKKESSVGVIKSNPAQSKHLNTATFKLHGRMIDINNLRTETYDTDSRIPVVALGRSFDCPILIPLSHAFHTLPSILSTYLSMSHSHFLTSSLPLLDPVSMSI